MRYKNLLFVLSLVSSSICAGTTGINGKVLGKIRAVGDFPGSTYDNSIELWFTTSITWPTGINCTNTSRVYVDAKHTHLVSAAYMALASGKTVNFLADDQLPNRSGSCEISYLDVLS